MTLDITIISAVITGVLGFLLGLFGGLIIQKEKFKDDLKLDKIRRLMPDVEEVQPILKSLIINIKHTLILIDNNDRDELNRYLDRIFIDFENYSKWFTGFLNKGFEPKMESIDYSLLVGLKGINVFSQLIKNNGTGYIQSNIQGIEDSLFQAECLIDNFLKS